MVTIQERKRRDGSTGCLVRIRIARAGVIVHEETRTFDGRRDPSTGSNDTPGIQVSGLTEREQGKDDGPDANAWALVVISI